MQPQDMPRKHASRITLVKNCRKITFAANQRMHANSRKRTRNPVRKRLVPAAAKSFFLTSQLLVITGVMALERAVKGRLEVAPLAAAIFLYSPPFAWGLVNFEFGIGVALWGIAVWLATQGRPWLPRALIH